LDLALEMGSRDNQQEIIYFGVAVGIAMGMELEYENLLEKIWGILGILLLTLAGCSGIAARVLRQRAAVESRPARLTLAGCSGIAAHFVAS
jgi:hypothetical protein